MRFTIELISKNKKTGTEHSHHLFKVRFFTDWENLPPFCLLLTITTSSHEGVTSWYQGFGAIGQMAKSKQNPNLHLNFSEMSRNPSPRAGWYRRSHRKTCKLQGLSVTAPLYGEIEVDYWVKSTRGNITFNFTALTHWQSWKSKLRWQIVQNYVKHLNYAAYLNQT